MAVSKEKQAALARAFEAWKAANTAYLQSRYRYDTATGYLTNALEALRADFLLKKAAVKRATEQYYQVLNSGKPVTLSMQDERLLFSEEQIVQLKDAANKIKKLQGPK
jgi:hypothetical protein